MDRVTLLKWHVFIVVIVAVITILCWRIGKAMKRPIYWINLLIIGIVLCMMFFYSSDYVFDRDGIRYEEIEWINGAYKNQMYYTKDGQAFHIQNETVVFADGEKTFLLSCVYLDADGYLVFDWDDSFERLNDSGVYLSDEYGHVYDLQSCSWNIFGKFVIPEKKGIVICGTYIYPFSVCEEYPVLKDQILSNIGGWFMAAPFLFINLRILYLIMKQKHFEKKNLDQKLYYNCMCYIVSISAVGVIYIIDSADSFMCFFIYELLFSSIMLIVIPLIQGRTYVEHTDDIEKRYPRGMMLRDLIENSVPSEVSLWRKRYIGLVFIDICLWIVICILHAL